MLVSPLPSRRQRLPTQPLPVSPALGDPEPHITASADDAHAGAGSGLVDVLRPASRLLQLRALADTPRLTPERERALEQQLAPGDIILITDNSLPMLQASTYALLGTGYTHTMMYEGDGHVLEASVAGVGGEGVVRTRLDSRVGRQVLLEVIRPPYQSKTDAKAAVDFCASKVGLPYDYTFKLDNDRAYYCTALLYHALRACPHPIEAPRVTIHGRQGVGLDAFKQIPGAQVVCSDHSEFWRNTFARYPEVLGAAVLSVAATAAAGSRNVSAASAVAAAVTMAVSDAWVRAHDPRTPSPETPPDSRPWQAHQRPATLLERTDPGTWRLGNVRWGVGVQADGRYAGAFLDSTIDTRAVRDVWMVMEPFPPEAVAAHALLCFDGGGAPVVRSSDGMTDGGVVVSVEVRLRDGERFDMGLGRQQHYPVVYQVGTWRDTVEKACALRQHRLVRYRLDLTQAQREALFSRALGEAVRDRADERYDTVSNNCVNSALRMINAVVEPQRRVTERFLGVPNPGTFVPTLVPDALDAHGLLLSGPRVITLPSAGAPPPPVAPAPGPASSVDAVTPRSSQRWSLLAPAATVSAAIALGAAGNPVGLCATAAAGVIAARAGRAAERAGTCVEEPAEAWSAPVGQRRGGDLVSHPLIDLPTE
ncbi:MAG: DUF4105 domain-containing protein [Proteobacteria bacterium]|nr:DUF4105 domain-containing protein [Pseudomonadota bacterium]